MQVERERVKVEEQEREAGGRLLKCENTKQETWNL